MDRAHRLGQTRPVTVYRLISKGTVEERILQRAKQKNTIQNIVIAGGVGRQVLFILLFILFYCFLIFLLLS